VQSECRYDRRDASEQKMKPDRSFSGDALVGFR